MSLWAAPCFHRLGRACRQGQVSTLLLFPWGMHQRPFSKGSQLSQPKAGPPLCQGFSLFMTGRSQHRSQHVAPNWGI